MASIALIGAGQIGSRHLQALAKLSAPTTIHLCDPSSESLERAARRFEEVGGKHPLRFIEDPQSLAAEIDVAIVATTADVRRRAVELLLSSAKVRHVVLEKVLFQRPADYAAVADLLRHNGVTAWVNCPRRMWSMYREIREKVAGAESLELVVTGSQWGLGCNAVHFIDLFAFLTGSDEIRLSTELLHPGSVNAKRTGFREFTGTLTGHGTKGLLALSNYSTGAAPLVVSVWTDRARYVVNEVKGSVQAASAHDGWTWREQPFQTSMQSQISHQFVTDLVENGRCELAPFGQSAAHHLALLDSLLRHLAASGTHTVDTCPIT